MMNVGELLIASLFVLSGVKGLFYTFGGFVSMLKSKGLPFPVLLAWGSLLLKTFGGLSIALDNKYSLLSTQALIVFMVAATVLYHNVFADPSQYMTALRNIAVIGGLWLLW